MVGNVSSVSACSAPGNSGSCWDSSISDDQSTTVANFSLDTAAELLSVFDARGYGTTPEALALREIIASASSHGLVSIIIETYRPGISKKSDCEIYDASGEAVGLLRSPSLLKAPKNCLSVKHYLGLTLNALLEAKSYRTVVNDLILKPEENVLATMILAAELDLAQAFSPSEFTEGYLDWMADSGYSFSGLEDIDIESGILFDAKGTRPVGSIFSIWYEDDNRNFQSKPIFVSKGNFVDDLEETVIVESDDLGKFVALSQGKIQLPDFATETFSATRKFAEMYGLELSEVFLGPNR